MMMSSSSLSKYVVLCMERQVFTRKFGNYSAVGHGGVSSLK